MPILNVIKQHCKVFNAVAAGYDRAATVQQEIGRRLFERLEYLIMKPRYVLDLGCGTGTFTTQLATYYPNAVIIGLDLAHEMLIHAQLKCADTRDGFVQADMAALPFETGLFDLVFANQALHWSSSLSATLAELNRVMRPGGCLMFSTVGPDTFMELKKAWAMVDSYVHTVDFIDMHDLGDSLLAAHFIDPVVDMEPLTVRYTSLKHLYQSLKAQGVRLNHPAKRSGLIGKQTWRAFESAMHGFRMGYEGMYPLTYEIIYGHAWRGDTYTTAQGEETSISLDAFRQALRKRPM